MNLIICIAVFILGLILLAINVVLLHLIKQPNHASKALRNYLFATFVVETFCFIIGYFNPQSNYFLSHIFFNIQLLFLLILFGHLIKQRQIFKYLQVTALVLWAIFLLQYLLTPEKFWNFNYFEIVSVSLMLIGLGLLHIYNTLGDKKYFYYFSLGLIMYFLCTCVIYIFGEIPIVFYQNPYIDHWILKDLFFICFQLLILKEYKLLKKEGHEQ